jgi:hypothetical protein
MSKSRQLRKRKKRNLPFHSSLFAFELEGMYQNVTKIKGNLYKAGTRSVWISPYNQLIFNLPRRQGYQGTLIHHFPRPINERPQEFSYFDKIYMIKKEGGWLEISSQYQADLVPNFVTYEI